MTIISNSIGLPSKRAFTLLELLVVLAILVVIATSIAGTYGRKNIEEAKYKMTLHEMQEIKKAFLRFESDNFRRLKEGFVDHEGNALPSSDFTNTFTAGHIDDEQVEMLMEFYETYGLWFLMVPSISGIVENTVDSDDSDEFLAFKDYQALLCEGWEGPYLEAPIREAWEYGVNSFPQIGDKYGGATVEETNLVKPLGVYRLLYYEHCEDLSDLTETIYRRLLLVAPRGNTEWDELTSDELLLETGNLRGGAGRLDGKPEEGRMNLNTRSFSNVDDSEFFILELKNMDIHPE